MSREHMKYRGLMFSLWLILIVLLYVYHNYVQQVEDWLFFLLLVFIMVVSVALYKLMLRFKIFSASTYTISLSVIQLVIYSWLLLLIISLLLLHVYSDEVTIMNSVQMVLNSILIIIVYGLMGVLWYGAGRRVVRMCGLRIKNGLGRALLSVVFGHVLTMLFFYGAALLGQIQLITLVVYVVVFAFIGWPYWKEVQGALLSRVTVSWSFKHFSQNQFKLILLSVLIIYSIFTFISTSALRPMDPDSVKTYAYIPYQMIQDGALVYSPYTLLNNSSFVSSYLYLPFVMLGPQYILYLNIFMLWMLIGSIYYVAKKYYNEGTALLASTFFLAMDFVFQFVTTAKNDLVLIFILLWSVIALLRFTDNFQPRWRTIAGVLFGVAIAVKYNALLLLPGLVILLMVYGGTSLKQRVINSMWFAVSVFTAFIPWALRNIILYATPFFPYSLTGKPLFLLESGQPLLRSFMNELSSYTHIMKAGNSVLQNVYLFAVNKSGYAYNKVGPLLFGLLPLLFFVRSSSLAKKIALIIIPTVIFWYSTYVSQVWYMMIVFPLIWIVIAYAVDRAAPRRMKILLSVLVGVFLLINIRTNNLNLATTLYAGSYSPSHLFQASSVETYINDELSQTTPHYLILPFGDVDPFLIEDHYLHVIDNDFFIYWIPIISEYASAEDIVDSLRERHITHVYFNKQFMHSIQYPSCPETPCPSIERVGNSFEPVRSLVTVIKEEGDWILFEVPRS